MTQETQTSDASGGGSIKIEKPKQTLLPTVAGEYTALDERYIGTNPYWFKNKFIEDTKFADDYTENLFGVSMKDPDFASQFKTEEDKVAKKDAFKANLLKTFIKESYVGEPLKDVLVNRTTDLLTKLPSLPTAQIKSVLRKDKNLEKYKNYDDAQLGILLKDTTLRKEITSKLYDEYQSELSKKHNGEILDADSTALGFNTFLLYGAGGVTSYVNAKDPEKRPEYEELLKRTNTNGFSLGAYHNAFTKDLKWVKQEQTTDLKVGVEKDFNDFTAWAYTNNGKNDALSKELYTVAKETDNGFLDKLFGEDLDEYNEQQLLADIEKDVPTDGLEYVIQKNVRRAMQGSHSFGMDDVYNTILANGRFIGEGRYEVDYDKLTTTQKLAFKMAQAPIFGNEYGKTIRDMGNGIFEVEPEKTERITQEYKDNWYPTTQKWVLGENGQMTRQDELTKVGSMYLGATQSYQTIYDNVIKPLTDFTLKALPDDVAKNVKNSETYRFLEERADVPIDDLTTDFTDSMIKNAAMIVTYGGIMFGEGATVLGGAGRVAKLLSGSKKAIMATEAAGFAAETLPQYSKLRTAVTNIARHKPLSQALKFEVGGMTSDAIQTYSDENASLYGLLGENVGDAYMRSDLTTKMFANSVVGLGIGVAADAALAAIRMPYQALKGSSKGLKFNAKIGDFEMRQGTTFNSDYRRIWYAATKDLADLPAGEVADAYRIILVGVILN